MRVRTKQIAALRYLIFKSQDGNDLAKRIMYFLIEQSNGLRQDICVTLTEGVSGFTVDEIREVANAFHAMHSSNCTTHLHGVMCTAGAEVNFSFHYGDYDRNRVGDPFNNDGQFPGCPEDMVEDSRLTILGMPLRYTFWLAREPYSRVAQLVVTSQAELSRIQLEKTGLYPFLESV